MSHVAKQLIATALLLSLCFVSNGCWVIGIFLNTVAPEKVKPLYELQEVPTVVLVDDMRSLLANPNFTGEISERVIFDLTEEKVLKPEMTISSKRVRELEALLGEEYGQTSIDRIGRALGAEQVIHVNVEKVEITAEPGVMHPQATVTVKVIDAKQVKRVFPSATASTNLPGDVESTRGHPVKTELRHRFSGEMNRGEERVMVQKLVDRIGMNVARLFYKHNKSDVGEMRN